MPVGPSLQNSFAASFAGSIGRVQAPSASQLRDEVSDLSIVKTIIVMSVPLGLAAVAQFSIGAMLIAAVGRMVGVEQLGATAVAFGLINSTAFTFSAGFCGALETVLSHSYGRDPNSKLYGVYAQRMTLILLIIAFLLGPILAFADVALQMLGQNPVVLFYTGEFCRVSLFGVFPAMMLELLRRYFACQHLNRPLSLNLVIGALCFPLLVMGLIKIFGYYGAPIAWDLLMMAMPGSLLAYMVYSGAYKKTWAGWDRAALQNWTPLLKLAVPSMCMMLSEWASLEINSITAGSAPPVELAAFSVVYQVSGVLWSITSGIFISSAVLVGNALGGGNKRFARRVSFLCVYVAIAHSLVNVSVVFLFRNYIPRLFSSDEEVRDIVHTLLPIFFVYHTFDAIQSCVMGILRGCGMQTIGAVAIALVYSVVGVPLGITLFFTTSLGVKALWIGPSVGVACVGFPIYCYLMLYHIKWDQLEFHQESLPSLHSASDDELISNAPAKCTAPGNEADDRGLASSGARTPTSVSSRAHSRHGSVSGRAPFTRTSSAATIMRASMHSADAVSQSTKPETEANADAISEHSGKGTTASTTPFASIQTQFLIPSRSILLTPQFHQSVRPNQIEVTSEATEEPFTLPPVCDVAREEEVHSEKTSVLSGSAACPAMEVTQALFSVVSSAESSKSSRKVSEESTKSE